MCVPVGFRPMVLQHHKSQSSEQHRTPIKSPPREKQLSNFKNGYHNKHCEYPPRSFHRLQDPPPAPARSPRAIRTTPTPSKIRTAKGSLEQLSAAAVHYLIAVGPLAGRKTMTRHEAPAGVGARSGTSPTLVKPFTVARDDFPLNAALSCEAHERDKLERVAATWLARPCTQRMLSAKQQQRARHPAAHFTGAFDPDIHPRHLSRVIQDYERPAGPLQAPAHEAHRGLCATQKSARICAERVPWE